MILLPSYSDERENPTPSNPNPPHPKFRNPQPNPYPFKRKLFSSLTNFSFGLFRLSFFFLELCLLPTIN